MAISEKTHNLALSKLDLKLRCNPRGQTNIFHQYTTHPLRISKPFRLDKNNPNRIYLYLRNNSPGLLAEDELNLSFFLEQDSQLHLTEQAATKVHPVLDTIAAARVNYQIIMEEHTSFEFIPEPLILYTDAALIQQTNIQIHPSSNLFWSEIILPGRLARDEYYQFHYYDSCFRVTSPDGKLLFKDRSYLEGKDNQFSNSSLFTTSSILGTAIAVYPAINCNSLQKAIDDLKMTNSHKFLVATSILPNKQGILIRVLSDKSEQIKNYFRAVLNLIRSMQSDSALPYIPK